MSLAGWDVAVAALQAEWSKLEAWIESQNGGGFMVNGVELSGRHVHWLATDAGNRIEQLRFDGPSRDETWSVASAALLYTEMLRAMLTGVDVPDPSGMRRAARRAYTVARMLRDLVAMLDRAEAQQQASASGGAS